MIRAAIGILAWIGAMYLMWLLFAAEIYILNRREQRRQRADGDKR